MRRSSAQDERRHPNRQRRTDTFNLHSVPPPPIALPHDQFPQSGSAFRPSSWFHEDQDRMPRKSSAQHHYQSAGGSQRSSRFHSRGDFSVEQNARSWRVVEGGFRQASRYDSVEESNMPEISQRTGTAGEDGTRLGFETSTLSRRQARWKEEDASMGGFQGRYSAGDRADGNGALDSTPPKSAAQHHYQSAGGSQRSRDFHCGGDFTVNQNARSWRVVEEGFRRNTQASRYDSVEASNMREISPRTGIAVCEVGGNRATCGKRHTWGLEVPDPTKRSRDMHDWPSRGMQEFGGTMRQDVTWSGMTMAVTITKQAVAVVEWIQRQSGRLFGFDIEWRPNFLKGQDNKTALLQLCGENGCLIVQMLYIDEIPRVLVEFLLDPNTWLGGVGIRQDIRKLQDDYGLVCEGAVDLASLACDKLQRNDLKGAGLKKLVDEVLCLAMVKPKKITMSNWEKETLFDAQVQYACIDAWSAFSILQKLVS